MRYLLDTHLILWALTGSPRLSRAARALIEDEANDLLFSPISIAEIAIKYARGRADFESPPELIRTALIDNGYLELPLTSAQAMRVGALDPVHKDPFDRLLIAQARTEGLELLTSDRMVERYGAGVRLV